MRLHGVVNALRILIIALHTMASAVYYFKQSVVIMYAHAKNFRNGVF